MFDRFSDEAKEAMLLARKAAQENHGGHVDDVHILIGCCRAKDSLAARVMVACGLNPSEVSALAEARARQLGASTHDPSQLPFTASAKKVLEHSFEEAHARGQRWIGSHHLLLGLLRLGNETSRMLVAGGLQLADASRRADEVHRSASPPAESTEAPTSPLESVRIPVLRSAQQVCVELHEFELASRLRDLIHRIESST